MALPDKVWIVVCQNGPTEGSATPTNCAYELVPSSSFAETSAGMTKEQYDDIFGAIISIVVTIIIFALLKKAIEQ
jgi:hypothetical protein